MIKKDKNIESLKYEGLASLIITQHKEIQQRIGDMQKFIDFRFTGIEEHNKKQNGAISQAVQEIAELKKESDERRLTCMMAVHTLQEKSKYTKLLWWIDKHPKMSVTIVFAIFLLSQFIVYVSVMNGWLGKMIGFIK